MSWKKITPEELVLNPIQSIGRDYFALCSESDGKRNAMTAAWGQIGQLWNKPVFTIYVRPSRYSKQLLDKSDYFVVAFLPPRDPAHDYLGQVSGYDDPDKIHHCGLHPVDIEHGFSFSEAKLTLLCRKLYVSPVRKENFLDASLPLKNYPRDDYSLQYIGEIVAVYKAD